MKPVDMTPAKASLRLPVCKRGNRLVGEAQFMAGAPLGADIVDQDGLAHALDGALGESVPCVGAGNEYHSSVEGAGHATRQELLLIEQISTPLPRSRFLGKVDLHGELLDADVGMRAQPEACTVLTILDPQRRAGQVDIAGPLDGGCYFTALEGLGHLVADLVPGAILDAEIS